MMSKDFAIFKSGFAPFLMKTSKNCQGKMNKKIESYEFGKVVVRRSQRTSSFGNLFGNFSRLAFLEEHHEIFQITYKH